jgi:hypothetical protein
MDTSYFVPPSAVFAIPQQFFTSTMSEGTFTKIGNTHHNGVPQNPIVIKPRT